MKLGIIGCGNMSKAILKGALANDAVRASDVSIKNSTPASTNAVAQELKVNACDSVEHILTSTNTIILGVKPAMITEVLDTISTSGIDVSDTLFISIAAGVTLSSMEAHLPEGSKIARTMPNTPTLVGEGVIAYTLNLACDPSTDEKTLCQLLENSASLTTIPEKLMDAVTGLSGSGPAYVYMFIEALADGAVKEGLPRTQALELAAKTVLGGAKMVLETGQHPASLKDQVASPGGTTIAGITSLEENGFRNAAIKAVQTAANRSKELS